MHKARRVSPEQIRASKCAACKARNVERKALRKEVAEQRQEEWRQLIPQQQLEVLDSRLGVGQGATKQRAKIAERMKEE